MRKILPLIAVIIFILTGDAFSQNWQWATMAGGIGSDKATDMDIDSAGNLYVSGYYNVGQPASFPAFFGSITAPYGSWGKEGFIAKIDSSGTWMWVKGAVGQWDERVLGTCVDKVNGFVYATGCTWLDINSFGNCSFAGGSADEIFVAKFDLNGNCQWIIYAGSDGDDHGFDLVTDKAGNIYLTGFISDHYGWYGNPGTFGNITVPMPPGQDSTAYIAKISPSGVFQWVKTFDAVDGERDNRIAIDSSANVFVTGGFWGTKQFGPQTVTSNGDRDIFVVKFDSSGNQLWVKTAGSAFDDRANGITVDHFNDIYITGEFRDKVGFDGDSINNNGGPNGRDIFVAKIKQDGSWVWGKKAGSNNGSERGDRIVSNKNGNLFVTGQINGEASFGPNITLFPDSINTIEFFVASIDTAGKWHWALLGEGSTEDRGTALACDDSCNLFAAGYFKPDLVIGSDSLYGSGSKEIFVAKVVNSCFNLPLPEAGFTSSVQEICQGECISFTDTSLGATSGPTWIFPGGTPSASTLPNPTVCFTNPGTIDVLLLVSNENGTDTAFQTIVVHPPPAANAGPDTCVIAGSSLTLTATGGGTYLWNTGDTTASIVINPVSNATYYVIVYMGNCNWGDAVNVNVYYPAAISGVTSICSGETAQLTASQGSSYLWSTGETTKSILVNPDTASVFSVTITDVCDTSVAFFSLSVEPLPVVFAGNDTTISLGASAVLSATGGTGYLWSTGETSASITVSPESITIFFVTATGQHGCFSSDSVTVDVDVSSNASVPSIFSPNGDGANDRLFVRGYGIAEIEFSVFNRWGEKVFETNDINTGWDGTYKGKLSDPSVFVFTLNGKFIDGSEIKQKGNVTLIR